MSFQEQALALARAGLPVFPAGQDKRPRVKWREQATCDPEVVASWWQQYPNALPGVPMGKASGLYAIDADINKETGETIGEATLSEMGVTESINRYSAGTPSGGKHFFTAWRDDLPRNSVKTLAGVDIRGEGGYVVAWQPEVLIQAKSDQWLNDPPGALVEALKKPKTEPAGSRIASLDTGENAWAKKALQDEVSRIIAASEGERNHAVNRAAFSIGQIVAGGGLARSVAEAALWRAAEANGVANEEPEQTRATIASGLDAGEQQPRSAPSQATHRQPPATREAERTSTFFKASTLSHEVVPDRDWLVEGWIPGGNVSLLMGDGGTGKSLLALQLAVSVSTGRNWIGRGVKKGPALVLSAEDDRDELHRRLHAICLGEQLFFPDLEGLTLRSLAGEDALLAAESPVALVETPLFKEVQRQVEIERPELVVLDTLADLHPSNENDRARARQFIGMLRGLAIRYSCAVLLLAHPSLSGISSGTGTSGSTGWGNSVRSRLYLTRIKDNGYEADPDARLLTNMKSNYGRIGEEIRVKWTAGCFKESGQSGGIDGAELGARARRVFLKLLRLYREQGRAVNPNAGSNYAPLQFSKHPDSEGIAKARFKVAMEELLSAGEIIVSTGGPPSKRHQFLDLPS